MSKRTEILEIDALFSDLETDVRHFVRHRTSSYLKDALSAGCFLYGAGQFGRRILALLRSHGITCFGIIDRNAAATGLEIDGIKIIHPSQLSRANIKGRSLVIGIHNHLVEMSEIFAFAEQFPFREVIWNADLPDALGPEANNFWLTRRDFIIENFGAIRAAANLAGDWESVFLLASLIRYRITGDATALPKPDLAAQYRPPDLISFKNPIVFVDGGAFTGDTYGDLVGHDVPIDHWVAFEPDPKNFVALSEFARSQQGRATLFPCGLANRFEHIAFLGGHGAASCVAAVSTLATMNVPCVAFDDVFQGIAPNYIKLDIEGAEQSALFGMERTLSTHQPYLAVSAYHRPDDIWVLMKTLAQLAPYANLYIRQHGRNGFDTVIYAIPR